MMDSYGPIQTKHEYLLSEKANEIKVLGMKSLPTFKNESFAEAGVNKNFYWTNKDVFSSETYRIFL